MTRLTTPAGDPSAAAPEPLERARQFLNTLDLYRGQDTLAVADQATAVLGSLGLGLRGPVTRLELDEVRELRRTLRARWVEDPDARPLASYDLTLHLLEGPDQMLRLTGVGSGIRAGMAELVTGLHVGQVAGQLGRLRACANPACRWFFWDASRPGTGRWCSMRICGSQHKSRAYRRRQG